MTLPKLHRTAGLTTTCIECGQNIIESRSEVCPGPPPASMPEGVAGGEHVSIYEKQAALLRITCMKLRTSPLPIADLIPMLQNSADLIDDLVDNARGTKAPSDTPPGITAHRPEHTKLPSSESLGHCSVYKRSHIFGNTTSGRKCIGCGIPDPEHVDLYARAAKAIMGTDRNPAREGSMPSPADPYTRVTFPAESVQWLRDRMSALRLDVLIERKRMLRDRGPDTSRHADILRTLEHDLVEINRITDALL